MLKKGLIVSCQALENEPLHSSFIMGRMALAAKEGGAVGIRANSVSDIKEIKETVNLPLIGIIKRDYPEAEVYITATMKEIDELVACNIEVIALDATKSRRPENQKLSDLFIVMKNKYPNQKWMADCSTIEEAIFAAELGFDYVGTTLVGYTEQSRHLKIEENDFEILRSIIRQVKVPVIAEGNIDSPDKARRVLEIGAYAVVVGGAITRPKQITEKFINEIKQLED